MRKFSSARKRRYVVAAAVAAATMVDSRAWADGTFTSSKGANVNWEDAGTWAATGDTGSQVFPGDGSGTGTETAIVTSTGGTRTWTITAGGWSYTLAELRNNEGESGQNRGATLLATNAGTINTSLITHLRTTGNAGGANFQIGSDSAQNISVVSNNLVINAVGGNVRLDESNVSFNSLTVQGDRAFTIEDNNGGIQTWNLNGATDLQGTGQVVFRYQAEGVAGDVKSGTSGLTTLRANAGTGTADMFFTRGAGSVVNRFAYAATTLDSNLKIDTDNTHVALGDVTVNGTRTLDLRDSSAATTANGISFTSIAGAAGSALTITGNSTHDLDVAKTGGMLGSITLLDVQANVKNTGAMGAAGGTAALSGQINLDYTPTATAGQFTVQAGGIINGDNTQLAALTRGGNVTLEADAVVAHDSNSANSVNGTGTIQNLGTDADLVFGITANFTQNLTIGTGTPWKGVGNDRTSRAWQTGTITANSDFTLQGNNDTNLTLGNGGSAGSVTIATGGVARTATIRGTGTSAVILGDADNNFANVTFDVQSGVLSLAANGMGVGAAAATGIVVNAGGTVDVGASNGINGPVSIKAGGILRLDDEFGLNGTGTITQEAGAVVRINKVGGIVPASGTQQSLGTVAGTVVRMEISDINGLDANVHDGAYFGVVGADRSQKAGLTISGGGLLNLDPAAGRSYTASTAADAVNTITVGPGGALFASSGGQDFNINPNVAAAGRAVTINTTAVIDGSARSGDVKFNGTFAAASVDVPTGRVVFNNADTNVTGDITLGNLATMHLNGGGESTNAGNLSNRLTDTSGLVANRVADRIVVGPGSLVEIGLLSPASGRLEVTQPFVIDGDVNAASKRRFYSTRRTGSVTLGVDYLNVTLNAGAVFGSDEDNTDVRARFILAGDATNILGIDAHDVIGTVRGSNLPAYDGSNPVTLNWGRLSEAANNQNIYGNIGAGTRIDMIKGQVFLRPGASVDGVIRTQTAPATGDSYVRIYGGADGNVDQRVTGTGRIELGRSGAANGAEDVNILVDADQTNQLGVHVVVVNDAANNNTDGVISVTRNAGTATTGVGEYRSVEIQPGAQMTTVATNAVLNVRRLDVGTGGLANFSNLAGLNLQMDRLAGGGTVRVPKATLVAGSVIAPGTDGAGKLTLDGGSLALEAGATYEFEIGSTPATSDSVVLTAAGSTVDFGAALDLFLTNPANASTAGQTYVLFDYAGADPASLPAITFTGPLSGDVSIDSANGRVVLTNVVPEPASAGLLAVAAVGLLARRRRRDASR